MCGSSGAAAAASSSFFFSRARSFLSSRRTCARRRPSELELSESELEEEESELEEELQLQFVPQEQLDESDPLLDPEEDELDFRRVFFFGDLLFFEGDSEDKKPFESSLLCGGV